MKNLKRVLSFVLIAIMLFGMLPAPAEAHAICDKCKFGSWKTENGGPMSCGYVRTYRVCKVCGNTEYKEDWYDHDWGSWKVVEKGSNCQEWDGLKERRCKVCGETAQDEMKGPHKWGAWKTTKEATCSEAGQKERKCSVCGKKEKETIPAGAHQWGEWVIIQEADPSGQVGIRERKCSLCGKTEREEFYPDGTLKRGDKGSAVEDIQEALNDQGFNCGTPDGDFGSKTENAVEKWQETNGYPVDGILWPDQADELRGNEHFVSAMSLVLDGTLPEAVAPVLNDRITIPVRLTNTGSTEIEPITHWVLNEEGQLPDGGVYSNFLHELNVQMAPGDSGTSHIDAVIQQEDIDKGYLFCTIQIVAKTLYYEGTDTLSVQPAPQGHSGKLERGEDPFSVYLDVTIPLSENAFEFVTVEKSITSTPANGEYYEQGETISYRINVVIPEGKTITDLEITDPLKGGNEDSRLDYFPTATSADKLEYKFDYVVKAEDVERGYVENSACAYFFDPEGDAWVEEWSETVTAPTGGEIRPEGLVLTKSITDQPSNGKHYLYGESITFAITIENTSADRFYDVIVYDPILEFAELKTYDVVAPGFSETIEFEYIVTDADVVAGQVVNTAFVTHFDMESMDEAIYSNEVTALCDYQYCTIGGAILTLGGVSVTKSVSSAPANGEYYVPGESVEYMLTVENTGALPLEAVAVRDNLYSSSEPVAMFALMNPGDAHQVTFKYQVTPMDALNGKVQNIASVVGYDEEGRAQVGLSDTIVVSAGMEGGFPFGVITDMTIVKEETSMPANGIHYTEGETISYLITYTNSGETQLGETLIYDTLATGSEIASAEMLDSGESRSCTFNYVVTAADVANGYVANSAIAKYGFNGYTNTAISNVVVSDTDGDPDTTYVPGTGKIDWEKIRGTAEAAEDTCSVKAVSRDGDSIEYEVSFCTEHAQIQKSILTMAKAADDAGKQQMVWEYAFALWQKEIDAMYEEILTACDDAAKITVMSERMTHLAMVANTQFALKIAEPDQAAEIAHAIASLWQDKCIDLCYLMNTAPAARGDSIFAVACAQNEAEIHEACACVIAEEAEDQMLFAEQYCPVHGFTYQMMELLLLTENSAENWETVCSLWEIELNTVYNDLYKAASEEGGMAYLAEYAAYLNWLPAYEQCMTLTYPENPEIAAEVMVNAIMARVLEACGR